MCLNWHTVEARRKQKMRVVCDFVCVLFGGGVVSGLCARQRQTTSARQRIGIMGNYGELWGIMGNYGELWGSMGNYGELWGNFGELWGIMGKFWGIMGFYGELWGIMGLYGVVWGCMGKFHDACATCLWGRST